jgi:protein O-mannosyl-transferase
VVCVLLAAMVVGVYWPVLSHGFTGYDDPQYVTENSRVRSGLGWRGVAWAFASLHGEHTYWHPLTWISHMADYQMFGLRAWGHHLINLLLHALNTVLVFQVFRRMTGVLWRCVLLAGLFALHPLQVDTVAWVAERKNLLSACFWLLTMYAYVRYAEKARPTAASQASNLHLPAIVFYLLSLGCFALGLMCKPTLVTLPFVLLLLDYWPLRRAGLNSQPSPLSAILLLLREKLPFFALAAASCLLTILAHRRLGMLEGAAGPSLDLRVENALVSYIRYLGNALWPLKLAVFYPHPNSWPAWKVVVSVLLLLTVSGAAVRAQRTRPYFFVGWFWFLGVLVPFIGVVQVGLQAMADRFMYVPLLGLLTALIWGAHDLSACWRCHRIAVAGAVAAALLFAGLTWRQIGFWKDDLTLWNHALAVGGQNDFASHNLAAAYFNQGVTLVREGNLEHASRQFHLALEHDPQLATAHYALGNLCQQQGRTPEALKHWREAARLAPQWPEPINNLAWVLATDPRAEVRDGAEALKLATRAVQQVGPGNVNVLDTLAAAYAEEGRFAEASATARQAEAEALTQGQVELAQRIQRRLALYASGQPFRDEPPAVRP